MDWPSFSTTIYSCPADSAREEVRTRTKAKTAPSSRTFITLPPGSRRRDNAPHARFLVGKATDHESAILQRDREIESAVGNGVEGELSQRIRVRGRPVRSLFHQHLNIGNRAEGRVTGKNLAADMDARAIALLLEQQVENKSVAFKNQMPVLQRRGAKLGDRFRP